MNRSEGDVPARVAARRFGITPAATRVRAHRGGVTRDRSREAAKPWIEPGAGGIRRVAGEADTRGVERVRDVAGRCGPPVTAVRQPVRRGEFDACRASRGRGRRGR